jgi:hypothetical protein
MWFFKSRGGIGRLRKYEADLAQLQKITQILLFLHSKPMAPFRHPLHFVSVVKEGYGEHGQLSDPPSFH